MDEELAELTADMPAPAGPPVLPVSEMTVTVQLLTRLVALNQNLVQQQSKKRINFPPLAAPKTARQLVAERRRAVYRSSLLLRVAEAQALWDELYGDTDGPPDDPAAGAEAIHTGD